MRSDFKPSQLKEANAKLDKHILSLPPYQGVKDVEKEKGQKSLWKKFLGIFKT